MNKITEKDKIIIENMIYEIRGKAVMLDSDLAKLYQCKNGTRSINLAVKRNIERFPEDFYFQLTNDEYKNLMFQNETSSLREHGGVRKLPYVFTEQGVAMLSSVLKTEVASKVSIEIMRAFIAMRKYISNNLIEQQFIKEMVLTHEKDIKLLQESFSKFEEKRKITEIYFEGQIYDAYSKIQEIFKKGKKELIIIDSYADNTILDIIKRLNVKVTIITKPNNLLTKQDIEKYNKQYHNLKVIYTLNYHDRYFILDNEILYHCGTSINRIGYKTFSITLIDDTFILETLLNRVHTIINN